MAFSGVAWGEPRPARSRAGFPTPGRGDSGNFLTPEVGIAPGGPFMNGARRPTRMGTWYSMVGLLGLALLIALAAGAGAGGADDQPKPVLKTEHFDQDPGWEGFNNRVVPKRIPTVTQDFGYSPTNSAGKGKGEMGGRVTRCTKPAYYAAKITGKTLNDKLSASGTFALTASAAGS